MNNLLKYFQCTECKCRGVLELVHDGAFTISPVLEDEYDQSTDGIMYDEPEICNYVDAWYRCGNCDMKIDCDPDRESLREYLEDSKRKFMFEYNHAKHIASMEYPD